MEPELKQERGIMVKGWGDYLSCLLFFFLFACLLATLGGYLWFLVFLHFLFSISFTLFIHIIHDHHVTVQRAGYGGGWFSNFLWWGRGNGMRGLVGRLATGKFLQSNLGVFFFLPFLFPST